MPQVPKNKNEIWMLKKFRDSEGMDNDALATSMNLFGWNTWTESFLDKLFLGTIRLDAEKREFIRGYLLDYLIDNL